MFMCVRNLSADIGPEDFQGDSRDLLRADAELTAKTRNRIRAHIAKETNGELGPWCTHCVH